MGAGLREVQAVTVPLATISSVGLLEKSATGKLQASFGDIVRSVLVEINDLGLRGAQTTSVTIFKAERGENLYPVFVRLTRVVSELLEAKLDKSEIAALSEASFKVVQGDVETRWGALFPTEIHNEILFSLSALKNAQDLARRVMSVELQDDSDVKNESEELRKNYNLAAQWSNFHFVVLSAAFINKVTLVPEVLQEVLAGLRVSVMAYAYVRQAAELRHLLEDRYSEEFNVVWDEEDADLADCE